MQFIQSEWKTKLALEVLVTEKEFPTLNSLLDFLAYARQATGMNVYANTMNPVNQGAYDSQYVSYLEELFLSIPIDDIFCTSNKATFILSDGTRARLGNKSLNPNHMKFSMTPDGVIHDHFERHFEIIEHNSELDEKLALADKKTRTVKKTLIFNIKFLSVGRLYLVCLSLLYYISTDVTCIGNTCSFKNFLVSLRILTSSSIKIAILSSVIFAFIYSPFILLISILPYS